MRKLSSSPRQVKSNQKPKAKKSVAQSSQYKVKNWSAYNQALKQRGSLTVWFSEEVLQKWYWDGPPQRRAYRQAGGAQFVYSDLAIETALTIKAIFHVPLRQTEGLIRSLVELLDLDLYIPDFSTLSRRQVRLSVRIPVRPVHEPLHIVVDGTGLKVYGEGEWKVRLHGKGKRRTWRKLHLVVDQATGEIHASTLTTNSVDEASQVEPLLKQMDVSVEAFGGDGAFDKIKVYDTLSHPPGQATPIRPVIVPRKDAKIQQHGNSAAPPLPRDENIRAIRKLGRKTWKAQSGYHRRSLAETAICRYKRVIGPQLRARELQRQKVEARIGCAILNRMAHLGMPVCRCTGRPESYKVEKAA